MADLFTGDPALLYQPPTPETSPTFRFLRRVNTKFSLSLNSYHDLYNWSTTHIDHFWAMVWDETQVIGHKGSHIVDKNATPAANPAWFSDAKLNWAENMLSCRSKEKTAVIQTSAFNVSSSTTMH